MAGFLDFLGFGKKSKPQTPEVKQAPGVHTAPFYQSLSDLASNRIKAGTTGEEMPGVWFGRDFLDRTTNPAIAQIDANFKNRTLPTLSSEQSKRGIARSSIATDQIGQADLQRNRDISSMVAEMFKLNEMQKKKDITEGIGVGENINSQYMDTGRFNAQQFNQMADSNANRNFQYATQKNADARDRQNNVLQAVGSLVSPILGDSFTKKTPTTSQPSTKQNLLGDRNEFERWLNDMFGGA